MIVVLNKSPHLVPSRTEAKHKFIALLFSRASEVLAACISTVSTTQESRHLPYHTSRLHTVLR
jgi:hypothetical protein